MQLLGKNRQDADDRKMVDPFVDVEIVPPNEGATIGPPEPAGSVQACAECGAAFLWLDRAGGHHCSDCEFPPSLAMVDRIVKLETEGGDANGRDGVERTMVDVTDFCWPILEKNFWARAKSGRSGPLPLLNKEVGSAGEVNSENSDQEEWGDL